MTEPRLPVGLERAIVRWGTGPGSAAVRGAGAPEPEASTEQPAPRATRRVLEAGRHRLPERVADELLVAGGRPHPVGTGQRVLEPDAGVEALATGVVEDGPGAALLAVQQDRRRHR